MTSLHASFPDAAFAQKALGALLDQGARKIDLAASFPRGYFSNEDPFLSDLNKATEGITTTTRDDAAVGAYRGAGLGLILGTAACVAALWLPDVGLVTGGAAGYTGLLCLAASALAGAMVGWVAGFLHDQGVTTAIAVDKQSAWRNGKAAVIVNCPTGNLSEVQVRQVLAKYRAVDCLIHSSQSS